MFNFRLVSVNVQLEVISVKIPGLRTFLKDFIWILNQAIDLMSWVLANGLGDRGSIPGRVIPKILKIVLDAALVHTQHYKVRIKGKVEQSRERSSALSYTSVL